MKRTVRIFAILIALIGSFGARAQNNSSIIQHRTHIFHLAPVMGRDFARLTLDSMDYTQGSVAGVAFTYRHRKKHISVSTSLLYASRGGEYNRVIRGQYGETYHWSHYEQLHYIEMPVKFTYLFFADSSKTFRPKISIGPSFGYLVSAKHVSRYEIPEWFTASEPVMQDVISHYQPFDVGATGSLGFIWEFRQRRWLTFEAGYTYGLTDINKQPTIKQQVMNRDIYAVVGIEFPLIRQRFK